MSTQEGGGQKMAKFCTGSCWMNPYMISSFHFTFTSLQDSYKTLSTFKHPKNIICAKYCCNRTLPRRIYLNYPSKISAHCECEMRRCIVIIQSSIKSNPFMSTMLLPNIPHSFKCRAKVNIKESIFRLRYVNKSFDWFAIFKKKPRFALMIQINKMFYISYLLFGAT